MFGFSVGGFFLFFVEKTEMVAHAVQWPPAIEGPCGTIPVSRSLAVGLNGVLIHIRVVVPLAVIGPDVVDAEPEIVTKLRRRTRRAKFTRRLAARVFATSVRRRTGSGFRQKFVEVDFFAPTCHVGNMSAGCAGRKDACAVV